MRKSILGLVAMTALIALTGCGTGSTDSNDAAKESNEQKMDNNMLADSLSADAKFAVNAADINMLEIKLGEIAETHAVNAAVKDLGKNMLQDHTAANEELKAMASQKNISLPAILSKESQKMVEDISGKEGTDFDKVYTSAMVDGHKEAIDMFKKQAESGNDQDMKAWAAGKVPVLEHHLKMSQDAKDKVDK